MKTAYLVQCTWTNLLDRDPTLRRRSGGAGWDDPDNYAVGPLLRAGLRPLMLVAPDELENVEAFPELAVRWGVGYVLGERFDVCARLAHAARALGADAVARVLLGRFYLDADLVRAQVGTLEREGADYCTLPRDFNVNFGCDAVRVEALEAMGRVAVCLEAGVAAAARFRPWHWLERSALFKCVTHGDVPEYPAERLEWIRGHPNWSERSRYGAGHGGSEYHWLGRRFLTGTETVLDAACGWGESTEILRGYARHAVGVDRDGEVLVHARGAFPHCEFHQATLEGYVDEGRFDAVFHMHTLEHVADEASVLSNLRRSLKSGGRLFCEVPLATRPGVVNPHHFREYTSEGLQATLEAAGFRVEETLGVSRGVYVAPPWAREGMLAVCRQI